MKNAAVLSAVVAFAAMTVATPTKEYYVARSRDVDVASAVDMTFTGPITVGGPNVTLSGTAESIYEQLLEKNPEYDPWDFAEYRERMDAIGVTKESQHKLLEENRLPSKSSLVKRDWASLPLFPSLLSTSPIECNPNGSAVGNYITQCSEGVNYLNRLNGYCGIPAGWGGCARVSCSHNCGIFGCNDNPFAINVWCGNIAGDVFDIAAECAEDYTDWVSSLKGQIFRDGPPAWNTIVKSQSC